MDTNFQFELSEAVRAARKRVLESDPELEWKEAGLVLELQLIFETQPCRSLTATSEYLFIVDIPGRSEPFVCLDHRSHHQLNRGS